MSKISSKHWKYIYYRLNYFRLKQDWIQGIFPRSPSNIINQKEVCATKANISKREIDNKEVQ